MRTLKMAVPVAMLAGFILFSAASFGKPAYSGKEKKACTFCHAKQETSKEAMTKNLTEAGKYYQTHDHSMEGYKGK
jgi:hypothetical protein